MAPHIEFLVGVGDPDDALCRKPGDIVDLPEEQADGWADGERAIRRRDLDGPPRETTTRPAPSTVEDPGGPPRETTTREPAPERRQVTPPPRTGAGSGAAAWIEFARAVGVDVDDDTKRDDVQAALTLAGVSLEEPHLLPAELAADPDAGAGDAVGGDGPPPGDDS